jgi:ribonuclease T1
MFASATRRSILVLASALAMAMPVAARSTTPGVVALESLPEAARLTDRRIRAGGPFPYAKDGTVFGNRERLLPREARGYYREYTVPTPGARDRGARRIVCGGDRPATPQACWYTADHYTSFKRIVH